MRLFKAATIVSMWAGFVVTAMSAPLVSNENVDEVLESFQQHLEEGTYETAFDEGRALLSFLEKSLGEENGTTMKLVPAVIYVGNRLGTYQDTLEIAEEYYPQFVNKFGENHPNTIRLAQSIAFIYTKVGRYSAAEAIFQEVYQLQLQELGEYHPDTLRTVANLAELYVDQGRYAKAEAILVHVYRLHLEALGERHPETLRTTERLARLYQGQGRYEEAAELFEKNYRISQEVFEDPTRRLSAQEGLAEIYLAKGRYTDAETILKEVYRIRREFYGNRHPATLKAGARLADVYIKQSQYEEALLLEEIYSIAQEDIGARHPDTVIYANTLATLYTRLERYAEAETLFEQAYRLSRSDLGQQHPLTLTIANNIATLYVHQGRFTEAETVLQEIYRARKNILGQQHPDTLVSGAGLAGLYLHQGRELEAEQLLTQIYQSRRDVLGEEHPDTRASMNELALLYARQGRSSEAVPLWERSLRGQQYWLSENTPLKHTTLHPMTSLRPEVLTALAMRHSDGREYDALSLSAILLLKGRLLEEEIRQRQARKPEGVALSQNLAAINSQLSAMVLQHRQLRDEGWQTRLDDLIAQRRGVEQRLAEAAQYPTAEELVSAQDFATVLSDSDRLLEFTRYPVYDPEKNEWGAEHYAVFVVSVKGLEGLVDLGPVEEIDELVERLLMGVRLPEGSWKSSARELDRRLLEPLERLLLDAKHLRVAPDGLLSRLPFGLLLDEDNQLLLERFSLSMLLSGRDLLYTFEDVERPPEPPLIMAGPDYNAQLWPEGAEAEPVKGEQLQEAVGEPWRASPMTLKEGRAVKRRIPDSLLLTGGDATERRLRAAQGPWILHLATYGYVLESQRASNPTPPNSNHRGSEVFPYPSPSTPYDTDVPSLETQLLQSGIVLAGANRHNPDSQNDGYITALEMTGLDLRGTELVVLSACETALGEIRDGEGVVGMRRALLIAGSERQILSLWKVDDRATMLLMKTFYEQLFGGSDSAESLWRAQQAVRSNPKWSHPYYWAAFQLYGDVSGFP